MKINSLISCAILSYCFFVTNVSLASGNNYYLSATGSDTSDGISAATAWANLSYACNQLHAGDTLYIMPGTYIDDSSGHQRCVIANSGTAGNPIKITAYDVNNKPQLQGISNTQGVWQGTGINIAGKSYVELYNLSITGYYQNISVSDSDNIKVDSCDIFGSGQDSATSPLHGTVLVLSKITNTIINNNKVHAITNGANLINLSGNQNSPTHDVTFSNNEIYNVSKHNGINIMNSVNNPANTYQRNIYNITIIGNTFHDIDKGVTDPGSGALVTNSASIQDSYVANNTVYDCGRGIIATGVNTTYYNNTVYNTTSVAPLGTQQSATGTMKNCFFDSNNAGIVFVGGVENTVIRNPLQTIKEYGGTGLIIRDIDLPSLLYWSVYEGSVIIEDTRSKIIKATKTAGISTYAMSPTKYYAQKSTLDISTLQDAATGFTITAYPAYAVPTSDYLTITPNTINQSTDTWDITVSSTAPENPTTFTLETTNTNMTYSIRRDAIEIGTAYTDNTGKLIYTYQVGGNEFDTSHNFTFVSTSIPAPNTYSLTINGGTGSGHYTQSTTVTISANTPPTNKVFDKWTGDTANVTNINSSTTTVTMPASSVTLTATYKDMPTLSSPIFSPQGGTYTTTQTITISSSQNATLYYTTDGTDPTSSSTSYTIPITISTTTTLKAIAIKTGYANTPSTMATYTINTSSGGGGSTGGGGGSSSRGGSSSGGSGGATSSTPTILKTEIKSIIGNTLTLNLSVTNASFMMLSDNSSFTNSSWVTYTTNPTYLKTDTQTKLYLKFKSTSGIISQVVSLDIPSSSNTNTGNTSTNPSLYPTGTLLKLSSSPRVYVVIQSKKKWISTPEVFTQLGYQWTSIQTISDTTLKQYPDYEDNLIRQRNDYKVYLVVNGVKRHIPNPPIFLDYGFLWTDVVDTDQSVIGKYKDTYLIKESGKDGIYYVNPQGVRKLIPTTEVFNSYGDKMTDVQIVSKLEMDSYPVSNLIRLGTSPDVYLVQGNIKKHVPSVKIANKYKLNLNQVMSVNQTEFDYYQSGGELK
jgi:hypothetical protein